MSKEEIKKIIGELDLHRLRKQLGKTEYGPLPVSIGDLFACGCYFIKQGKKELGQKLCRTALLAYEIDHTLISRILNMIRERNMSFLSFSIPTQKFQIGFLTMIKGSLIKL